MQEHTEQQLDSLAKKMMQASKQESPSIDFTANVMQHIKQATIGEALVYKPLITKTGWFVILSILVGILVYAMLGNTEGTTSWLDQVDFSAVSNNKFTDVLSGITISKTLSYAIGLCGLLFFVQIPVMKYLMNKRLGY